MYLPLIVKQISGTTILIAMAILIFSIILKRRELLDYIKKIPLLILLPSLFILIWGLFFVPKNFSGRGEMGVWMMSKMNNQSWLELLSNTRTPVYLWQGKFFSKILDGISYEFLVSLNFLGFILSVFFIYLTIFNLTKNKIASASTSFFYLISPVIFTFSLTEDYTLPALFYTILCFFFASIWVESKKNFYLFPAMATALLAAGSRTEYIFLPYLFIIFYLFFKQKEPVKNHILRLSTFFIVLIPRTVVSVGMYFVDAQHDYALHRETYTYKGDLTAYLFQVLFGSPRTELIRENIERGTSAFLNFHNLNGFFLLLALISLVIIIIKRKTIEKNTLKTFGFFFFMFLLVFFYYNALHPDGIIIPRYIVSAITPLIVLAGIGTGLIFNKRKIFFYPLMAMILIFSLATIIIPVGSKNHYHLIKDRRLHNFITHDHDNVKREHQEYKNLSYENRISRLLGKKVDVPTSKKNTYFIINGERSFLHTMPINGIFVDTWEIERLIDVRNKIASEDKIYVSQSEMGFTSHMIDGYNPVDPQLFEKTILQLFELEEVLISYEQNDHHAFLYKMRKK